MKKIFEWEGNKVEYSDEGTGAALLCIPSWASSMAVYQRFSAIVDKKKIRLIILNMPGWGDAPRKKDFIPTFDAYARLLSAFISHIRLKDYSILGYSAASGVILSALSIQKIQPRKVILVSPFGSRQDFLEEKFTRIQLNLFQFARWLHFPPFIIKSFMILVYIFILMLLPEYRKMKNIKHFIFITAENIRSDFTAITEPIVQSKDFDGKELMNGVTQFLIIYSKNEMKHYVAKFMRLKNQIMAETYANDGADHRHFAFQPEQSMGKIEQFVLSR
jgi:pimeloyl-ACP methyl ester carboxylesterase